MGVTYSRFQYLRIRRLLISCLFLLGSLYVTAQEKGIVLKKENSKRTVFLNENRRVKVTTTANKKWVGNYTIIDDKTIMIKDTAIPLDSVATISSHSKFSSVANPALITIGSVFVIFGTAGVIAGSYGVLLSPLIPVGLPMGLVPVLASKHKSQDWNYQIVK